jgi:hypothetical protein
MSDAEMPLFFAPENMHPCHVQNKKAGFPFLLTERIMLRLSAAQAAV